MTMKTLKSISWDVPEEVYRQDPALSYSTIARYAREGFNNIPSLFNKVETPSLTFGSQVDALITGGQEEYDKCFFVADFPEIKDSVKSIIKKLFTMYGNQWRSIDDIPNGEVMAVTTVEGFQPNWKPETRVKVIKEQGAEYYQLMYLAKDKTIVSTQDKYTVDKAVEALKTSESTRFYFAEDNPFDGIQRFYQLKFKANLDGVDFRIMMDLAIVDNNNKIVIPCDLKTSSHTEWDFYQSFIDWNYSYQAKLYYNVLRYNMDKDDQFKDYELANYRFIVVNKKTLTPLVWEYKDTKKKGTLIYGKNNSIIVRDPIEVGKELHHYLSSGQKVPNGIKLNETNDIVEWLNTL